mmetsp:Transcript_44127/g.138648  ORF Transcript_44127/g.138648 Transcript_44127/m.138648 type:complete len:391 (-) Transcript_44127:1240-2412(-)|eukprot:CAMPEP_0118864638 /NCGR_PEP_ID=MMETSP1163-20130328/9151_1 /TAXON_ID=124430 /ORGANISM="Phaeomonas parva, Strain CCMP2877" /LENGTH=390 /DNA_ID=CAMNT_0006798785 /DNA_START=105 /DNA_END=1277 /DNA_ORIENTATION=+
MLSSARLLRRAAPAAPRGLRAMSTITVDLEGAFLGHRIEVPEAKVEVTKEELMEYFRTMYTMRRMEITCDNEYKARNIRGFCHLYDGQEAVAMGIEAATDHEDSWITSYRCHCVSLLRGGTVASVFGELLGRYSGQSQGKGGSMHLYSKKENFYGGQGIVGAQVPVGAGLAFANKYKTPPGEKMPIALAAFGDGAANQGQVYESSNMAALWKLPLVLCIENNQYGMGTSTERSTANNDYHTMGNTVPGIKIDGMNVLAVKKGMEFVKEYCGAGNGPMYVEMNTYRYHGHSMSDPGTTYRTREEIQQYRQAKDPIEYVKKVLIEHDLATADELKALEKELRKEVQNALAEAKASPEPDASELFTNIYIAPDGSIEYPPLVRMPDIAKSVTF